MDLRAAAWRGGRPARQVTATSLAPAAGPASSRCPMPGPPLRGGVGGFATKVHYFGWTCPTATLLRKAWPGERAEAFLDGHVSDPALGGSPQSLYDNTKLAVADTGPRTWKRTRAFELQSHYLFEDRFESSRQGQ